MSDRDPQPKQAPPVDRYKLGLFGGSFDPIHNGHIEPVRRAAADVGLDRVLFLPTARPPHKEGPRHASAWRRYAMVEMALLDDLSFEVSARELTLGKPAYTVETLEHFGALYPDADLYLLVGADSYNELDSWKRWWDIQELARIVVLARDGSETLREDLPAALRDAPSDRTIWVQNNEVIVSSTAIRASLAAGERPDGVPAPVLDFCNKYGLYRGAP